MEGKREEKSVKKLLLFLWILPAYEPYVIHLVSRMIWSGYHKIPGFW